MYSIFQTFIFLLLIVGSKITGILSDLPLFLRGSFYNFLWVIFPNSKFWELSRNLGSYSYCNYFSPPTSRVFERSLTNFQIHGKINEKLCIGFLSSFYSDFFTLISECFIIKNVNDPIIYRVMISNIPNFGLSSGEHSSIVKISLKIQNCLAEGEMMDVISNLNEFRFLFKKGHPKISEILEFSYDTFLKKLEKSITFGDWSDLDQSFWSNSYLSFVKSFKEGLYSSVWSFKILDSNIVIKVKNHDGIKVIDFKSEIEGVITNRTKIAVTSEVEYISFLISYIFMESEGCPFLNSDIKEDCLNFSHCLSPSEVFNEVSLNNMEIYKNSFNYKAIILSEQKASFIYPILIMFLFSQFLDFKTNSLNPSGISILIFSFFVEFLMLYVVFYHLIPTPLQKRITIETLSKLKLGHIVLDFLCYFGLKVELLSPCYLKTENCHKPSGRFKVIVPQNEMENVTAFCVLDRTPDYIGIGEYSFNYNFGKSKFEVDVINISCNGQVKFLLSKKRKNVLIYKKIFYLPKQSFNIFTHILTFTKGDEEILGVLTNRQQFINKEYCHMMSPEELALFMRNNGNMSFIYGEMNSPRGLNILSEIEINLNKETSFYFDSFPNFDDKILGQLILHNFLFFNSFDNLVCLLTLRPGFFEKNRDVKLKNKQSKKYRSDISTFYDQNGFKRIINIEILKESEALSFVLNNQNLKYKVNKNSYAVKNNIIIKKKILKEIYKLGLLEGKSCIEYPVEMASSINQTKGSFVKRNEFTAELSDDLSRFIESKTDSTNNESVNKIQGLIEKSFDDLSRKEITVLNIKKNLGDLVKNHVNSKLKDVEGLIESKAGSKNYLIIDKEEESNSEIGSPVREEIENLNLIKNEAFETIERDLQICNAFKSLKNRLYSGSKNEFFMKMRRVVKSVFKLNPEKGILINKILDICLKCDEGVKIVDYPVFRRNVEIEELVRFFHYLSAGPLKSLVGTVINGVNENWAISDLYSEYKVHVSQDETKLNKIVNFIREDLTFNKKSLNVKKISFYRKGSEGAK